VTSFKTHGPHRLAAVATPPPLRATPTPTPARTARRTTRTVRGDAIQTRFGDVQVSVTLRARRLTAVRALQLPFDHPRSRFISQQVEPLLRQEALQAQSAQIDVISGATYTSEAYAQSLQSALSRSG
jgi:uncharacterized protein with FMN-binding domain